MFPLRLTGSIRISHKQLSKSTSPSSPCRPVQFSRPTPEYASMPQWGQMRHAGHGLQFTSCLSLHKREHYGDCCRYHDRLLQTLF